MLRRATSKFAHNPAVTTLTGTSQDLKLLQNLISAEKTVLLTLQKLSADYAKASEALRAWSLNEGDDLGGILTASTLLLNHFSSALLQYASHGDSMRRHLKAIRTRAENLDDLKRQRNTMKQKARESEIQLRSIDPRHKKFSSRTEALNNIRKAVREMNSTIKLEEAVLYDFKRTSTKIWMGLKFGGLIECCEKGAIAGRFGNLIIAEISEEMTQPGLPRSLNYRRNEVECCVANAHRGVNGVTLSTVPNVGFRDRDQYIQRSSDAHSNHDAFSDAHSNAHSDAFSDAHDSDAPQAEPLSDALSDAPQAEPLSDALSDAPQAEPLSEPLSNTLAPPAFYISPQIGYGEPFYNGPSSLSGEPLPPTFPQPQCSCVPSSLPQTLPSFQQPVVSNVNDNVVNPSNVTDPEPIIASSDTDGGQITSDAALETATVAVADYTHRPGTFGSTKPDPFSIRAFRARDAELFGRYADNEEEEDLVAEDLSEPKPGVLSKFFRIFTK